MSLSSHDACSMAEREIAVAYGDKVSFFIKGKPLNKFGRTDNADSGIVTTVGIFQDAVVNETYATDNTIDSIVSTSGSDTTTVTVEGHKLVGTDFVFVSQNVTLTGQTPALLTTPLVRATRIYNGTTATLASPAPDLVGAVAVYDATEATGVTLGKPDVDTAVKVMIAAGEQQSQKCSTTVSYLDYWAITALSVGVERNSPVAAIVDVEIQVRRYGGVWRPAFAKIPIRTAANPSVELTVDPCFIVPKNSDVRVITTSDTDNTIVHATLFGRLGQVITNRAPL